MFTAAKEAKPTTATKDGVTAILIGLHDRVGSRWIGAAINALDAKGDRLRVNRVRYYTFAVLKKTLLDIVSDKEKDKKKAIAELLP